MEVDTLIKIYIYLNSIDFQVAFETKHHHHELLIRDVIQTRASNSAQNEGVNN